MLTACPGLNAYWSPSHDTFSEVIGLTVSVVQLQMSVTFLTRICRRCSSHCATELPRELPWASCGHWGVLRSVVDSIGSRWRSVTSPCALQNAMEGAPRSGMHESSHSVRVSDLCRSTAQVLYTALVSGFANVHLRVNIAKLEEAIKYGYSAGDRCVGRISSVEIR